MQAKNRLSTSNLYNQPEPVAESEPDKGTLFHEDPGESDFRPISQNL